MLSSCAYKHPGWCGSDCTDTRTPRYNKENTYLTIFLHSQVRIKLTQHKDKNTQVQHRKHLLAHLPPHSGWCENGTAKRQEHPGTTQNNHSSSSTSRLVQKWYSTKTRTLTYNTENTYLFILLHIQAGVKMTQHKDTDSWNTHVQHREHLLVPPPPHPVWCENGTAQRYKYTCTTQRTPTCSSSSTSRLAWKWRSTKTRMTRYKTENTECTHSKEELQMESMFHVISSKFLCRVALKTQVFYIQAYTLLNLKKAHTKYCYLISPASVWSFYSNYYY